MQTGSLKSFPWFSSQNPLFCCAVLLAVTLYVISSGKWCTRLKGHYWPRWQWRRNNKQPLTACCHYKTSLSNGLVERLGSPTRMLKEETGSQRERKESPLHSHGWLFIFFLLSASQHFPICFLASHAPPPPTFIQHHGGFSASPNLLTGQTLQIARTSRCARWQSAAEPIG